MRRLAAGAMLVASLTVPSVAYADTTSPTPLPQAQTYPVEDLTFVVENLTFGSATADGALTDNGAKELTLLSDVFFDHDKATLNPKATAALASVVTRLRAAGAKAVTITGYTDSDGDPTYNVDLSKRRAEAVRAGIGSALPGVVLTANGLGEENPVAENKTPAGKAKNRRVTVTITR